MSRDREGFGEYNNEIRKKIKREFIFTNVKTTGDHAVLSSPGGVMGRRHVAAPPGTTLNTVTPCAACKLLRRRCAEECPFSPYFSPHEPHKFAAVHKVFGASNVSKMLMEVPESQRSDAANSLVYEANLRLRDPVYGCMGAISALQHQIQSLQAELTAVRSDILRYKYREAATAAVVGSAVSPNDLIAHTKTINNSTATAAAAAAAATLVSEVVSVVTTALPTQSNPTPPWTPPPSLPSPSLVVSSSSSNSNSSATTSMYNPPPSAATVGYSNSNMSSENNVHYFD